jgi:hypothetical protein
MIRRLFARVHKKAWNTRLSKQRPKEKKAYKAISWPAKIASKKRKVE